MGTFFSIIIACIVLVVMVKLLFMLLEVVLKAIFSTKLWIWVLLALVVYGCFFAPADSWTRIFPEFFGAAQNVLRGLGGLIAAVVGLYVFFKYLPISIFKAILYALIAFGIAKLFL